MTVTVTVICQCDLMNYSVTNTKTMGYFGEPISEEELTEFIEETRSLRFIRYHEVIPTLLNKINAEK